MIGKVATVEVPPSHFGERQLEQEFSNFEACKRYADLVVAFNEWRNLQVFWRVLLLPERPFGLR
mgnify:CR=1 FL=1